MAHVAALVVDDAIRVLENVGVWVTNPDIIEKFEGTMMAAYDTSSKRIHILRDLVKACIETSPGRDRHPVPNHSFGGGGVAAFIEQGDDYVTPCLDTHIAEAMRIAEEFNVPFMFKPASAKYTPDEERRQIEVCRRYYSGYLYMRVETEVGTEYARNEHEATGMIATTHSVLDSPLKFNQSGVNWEVFNRCVTMGLPLYITSMPISCLTGPASAYGMAVLATAEFLAAMCLAQIINPGVMCINGAYPAGGSPTHGYAPRLGTLFHNKCNLLAALAGDVLGLPSIQSGCTISGEHHEPREGSTDADTETGYNIWLGASDYHFAWHQVRHSFGFVNSLMAFNLNKMRRDLVALESIKTSDDHKVVESQYDKEALDAIQDGVSRDDFRTIDHTLANIGTEME